LACIRGTPS
jgi:hypothetical protein